MNAVNWGGNLPALVKSMSVTASASGTGTGHPFTHPEVQPPQVWAGKSLSMH